MVTHFPFMCTFVFTKIEDITSIRTNACFLNNPSLWLTGRGENFSQRESSQGESSGLRVRLEGSLKTHYDAYSLPANACSLC